MKYAHKPHILFLATATALSAVPASAHWNSKGPYGGSVSCMAAVDTNVFVGTYEGGLFINSNPAATVWKPVNQGMTSGHITSVTQIGGHIIAGTADAGVFLSTDRGGSWIAGNSGLGNLQVQALAVNGANVFAGTDGGGVFLSTDSGATWTAVNTGLSNQHVTALAVSGSNVFAATAGGGVFSTSNNGTSWSTINTGLSGAGLMLNALVADGSMLYASNTGGVYMYMGGAWAAFNTGLANTYVTALGISGGDLYAATAAGVFRSVSMGAWTAVSTGLPADTVTAVTATATKVFAGTKDKGIYSSSTGTISFAAASNGFNNLKTYAMVTQDTNTIVTATNKGVFLSTDLAASYSSFNAGLTDSLNVTCLLADDVMKFAGTRNAGVFSSMNNGTWSPLGTGLSSQHIKALTATSDGGHKIYAATADGKVFSIDSGAATWTDVSTGLPSGLDITALKADGSMLYLSAHGGGVYHYMSGSWAAMNSGLSNMNVTSLAVLDGNVYAGTAGGGVFKAAMMGSWTAMNSGLPSLNILSLDAAAPYVIAGYRGGAYITNDGGATWEIPGIIANLPPFADVTTLSLAKTRVFAGTPNNSLYSNSNSELPTAIATLSGGSRGNGILTTAPNPNNGSFMLTLTQTAAKDIRKVELLDIAGKRVALLQNAVRQQVSVTAPAGVYFIQAVTVHGTSVQKIIIQ